MKIRDGHLYHGAALAQIVEHQQFTAINALKIAGRNSRSAYRINDSIVVYLKYATKPSERFNEYIFNFNQNNLDELQEISKHHSSIFITLVCYKDRQICCLPYKSLLELVRLRKQAKGKVESQYSVICVLKPKSSFRVNMNQPNSKGTYLTDDFKIKRRDFPNNLFR